MQTRYLLIASALLAVVILVAGGLWLFRLLT
jgi:PIN domain nuclease of toxin-antitoxin system